MNRASLAIFVEGAPCRVKPIGEESIGFRELAHAYPFFTAAMRMMLDTVVRNPVDFRTHVAYAGLSFGAGVNVRKKDVKYAAVQIQLA